MANKVRVDKNGNTLRIGESQNKKDGRYCYKWMDKVSNKRRTIYHTDVSMTLNVYDHVDAERMKNEMKKLI